MTVGDTVIVVAAVGGGLMLASYAAYRLYWDHLVSVNGEKVAEISAYLDQPWKHGFWDPGGAGRGY